MLDIDENDQFIKAIIPDSPRSPLTRPLKSISAIFRSDPASNAMAVAMPTSEATLIPDVNASIEPLRESSASLTFLTISFSPPPSSLSPVPKIRPLRPPSLSPSRNPMSFFAARNIPPPAKPAKTSPPEILSEIHPNIFRTPSPILPRTFTIVSPMVESRSLKLPILSTVVAKKSDIPSTTIDRLSETPPKKSPVSALALRVVKKSPIRAAPSKKALNKPPAPSEPSNLPIGDSIVPIPLPIKSNIEKKPFAARLILSRVSSVGFKVSVNFLNFSVMSYTC